MKRSMCGLALLAALTFLGSCGGDPTESIREGEHLIADPTSVLIDQGTPEFVTAQLVDGQGNPLEADIVAENAGAGITVEKDLTYLNTTIGTSLATSSRFVVGATAAASTSFVLRSGEHTLTIPVRVVPILEGTGDPSTAPFLELPPVGQSNSHFDRPAFAGGAPAAYAYYQITVPADVPAVTITLNWLGDADMDLVVCPQPFAPDLSTCDFAAASSDHPESHTYALTPGTYVLAANLFAEAAPPNLLWEFTSETAAPAP